MEKKVYEILGMDRCTTSTTYLGVKVNLEFKGGDMLSHKNGYIATSNPFVQAAIEAMPSFGQKIVLKEATTHSSVVAPKKEEVAEASTRPTRAKVKAFAPKKEGNVVESVKNVNDAASYFSDKGIVVESPEHLKELMAKHNVVFPNLAE